MRLNHDCIRDIMLYIETQINTTHDTVGLNQLVDNFQNYTEDVLIYHINQLVNAGFIQKPMYGGGKPLLIPTFTWKGHEYLDNIRDKSAWEKLHESGLSSFSLDIAKDLAGDVTKSLLKKKLGLE